MSKKLFIEEDPPLCLNNCEFKQFWDSGWFCNFYDINLTYRYSFSEESFVLVRCTECHSETFKFYENNYIGDRNESY